MAWLRIAHRGAAGSAPEHTQAAFRRALDLGVDMIEFDVQLSRDEELVVMHDLDLQRTTTGSGKVREHDFADIKRLDAGSWFGPGFARERPLCLREVIEIVRGRARLNVEIKAPEADWPVMAARLIQTLRTHELTQSTIVSCFDPGALAALRERADDVQLGLLWQRPEVSEAWKWTAQLRALSFHPHWMLVSPDLLDAARARGLAVLVWTVNEVDTMRALVRQGVGGIISDFPQRFAVVGVESP